VQRVTGVSRALMTFLRRWNSRPGIFLAVVHAALLLTVIISKPPDPPLSFCPPNEVCFQGPFAGVTVIAGRSFHLHYENGPTQFLMLVDIPGLLVGSVIMTIPSLILSPFFRHSASSYYLALEWILYGSMQWWLIGGYLHRRLQNRLQSAAAERQKS